MERVLGKGGGRRHASEYHNFPLHDDDAEFPEFPENTDSSGSDTDYSEASESPIGTQAPVDYAGLELLHQHRRGHDGGGRLVQRRGGSFNSQQLTPGGSINSDQLHGGASGFNSQPGTAIRTGNFSPQNGHDLVDASSVFSASFKYCSRSPTWDFASFRTCVPPSDSLRSEWTCNSEWKSELPAKASATLHESL